MSWKFQLAGFLVIVERAERLRLKSKSDGKAARSCYRT